jgi:hypothetical protein
VTAAGKRRVDPSITRVDPPITRVDLPITRAVPGPDGEELT